jgi:gamma-glutamyltranspeptidase/glutathione hydrolase
MDARKSFVGGVVADEPRAAQIGREMLEAGGSAADAVASMFFALTATYPVAASLGGGGVCVAYDPGLKRSDALLFLSPAAATSSPAIGGPIGVPAAARGMAALQGRYGRARWERVVAPAEQIARFGFSVSRAYGSVLSASANDLTRLPALAPVFQASNGRFFAEGQPASNPALAETLSRLRTAGVTDGMTGELARRIIDDAARLGGTLTIADLQSAAPQWIAPRDLPGGGRISVLVPPTPAGEMFASAWPAIAQLSGSDFLGLRTTGTRAKVVEAIAGFDTRAEPRRSDIPGSTGFSAMDASGQAVSCTVTVGQPFGLRAVGASTGILFSPPARADDESAAMLPAVAANASVGQSFIAAAATEGSYAPVVLADTIASVLLGGRSPDVAVASPRVMRAGNALVHEPNFDTAIIAALSGKGLRDVEAARLSKVGLMYCDGLPRGPDSCRFVADPRGFGLAQGDIGKPLGDRERRCFTTRTAEVCD